MKNERNCPICNSLPINGNKISVPDYEYNTNVTTTFLTCSSCKSLYQDKFYELAELASFYPENYHSFKSSGLLFEFKNKLRFNGIKKFFELNKRSKITILDYGCGNGGFIKWAKKKYPQIDFYGYEISQSNQISNEDGVQLIFGSIDFLLKNCPKIDTISMNHVIEHLPNPKNDLIDLISLLSPKGTLVGQTPQAGSFEMKLFKKYWSGFHAPRHTVIFSKKGMEYLFTSLKLKDYKIEGAFNPAQIAVSILSILFRKDGKVLRSGMNWLLSLIIATIIFPFDLLIGPPGIINFRAQKN